MHHQGKVQSDAHDASLVAPSKGCKIKIRRCMTDLEGTPMRDVGVSIAYVCGWDD